MESSEIHNQQSHKTNIDFIHYGCSLIGLTLLPLAGTAAQIGMGLILLGLARIPTTFQSIKTLSRSPIVLLILAWWIIAYLSLAWSIESTTSLLASPISILIIPALTPFLSKSKSYIYALAIGGGIHAAIQIFIWFGAVKDAGRELLAWSTWVAYSAHSMNGGLHWYPPYTGLWAATIFLLVLGLIANTGSWKNRTPLILLALALTVSILLSGSRLLFLFVPLSILVVLIRLIALPNLAASRRALAAIFISITVVSAGAVLIPETFVNKRVKMLFLDRVKMTETNNYDTSLGLRYLWWRAGFKIWKRSPWIGHGGGSIMEQFALQETMMPSEFGANVTDFITPDPHSSFLATSIEQGILGASCMISFILVSLISAWRKAVSDPATLGLVAAWSILVAMGLFHTIHLSAYAIPLVSVLTVLSIHSIPPHSQLTKENP